MDICDTCGNAYDKAFFVKMNGASYTFDSFECAIAKLAPRCLTCSCRIVGHGVEDGGAYYCSAHCARKAGSKGLTDRL